MYMCIDCGAVFEELGTDEIVHSEVDAVQNEIIGVCPQCGSMNYEDGKLCPICEEYFSSFNKICDKCREKFNQSFKSFVRAESMSMDVEEDLVLELIDECLG